MNRQEVFTKVATHLLRQGKRAQDAGGYGCRYRGEDGTMCAIGCLISDEAYRPDLEGRGVNTYYVQEALEKSGVVPNNYDDGMFLQRLQEIHDSVSPSEWRYALSRAADHYQLTTPEVLL